MAGFLFLSFSFLVVRQQATGWQAGWQSASSKDDGKLFSIDMSSEFRGLNWMIWTNHRRDDLHQTEIQMAGPRREHASRPASPAAAAAALLEIRTRIVS